MAKKEKSFMVIQTKEEFDRIFDRVMSEGRAQGFKEGSIWTFSYFYELAADMFEPQAFMEAEKEIRHRNIEKWRKDHSVETLKQRLDMKHVSKES